MITLTDAAIAKIKEMAEAEELQPIIRLGVKGGGCSGFTVDMCFDEQINDTDEVFERDGVKLVVDSMSLQYVDGSEVDYVSSVMQSGFKVNNPNATGSCGCGKSFSA